MKSLKRTLCLVLALVMVLGLFGVASASKFTDDNTIQYKEAVDVMTGIGAISGMGDGTFNPKGTITRAQAAKLVTYAVLGKAAADRLTGVTSSFTDVTVEGGFAWAIPSIEYLVREGVINGMGDGTFDPNGEISGYAVLKLLLCSLGRGAKGEYVGASWDLNVAIDAGKAKLTDGRVDTNKLSDPATREEVALYCLNTIQQPMVKYISTLDIYTQETIAQNTGNNQIVDVPATLMNTIYRESEASGLHKATGTDAYGRPATKWDYMTEDICLAANKPILTYTKGVTVKQLKLDVANAGYKFDPVNYAAANAGAGTPEVPAYPAIVTNNGTPDATPVTTLGNDAGTIGGKGILTEVYGNALTKEVTNVVSVSTILVTVTKVTPDDPATTNIDERALELTPVPSGTAFTATVKTDNFNAVYATASALYEAGQEFYLTAVKCGGGEATHSANHALAVGIPQTAQGKVSLVTKNTAGTAIISFVADGKTYEVGENALIAASAVAVNSTYTIVLDSYGYALAVKGVEETSNFGVVTDVDQDHELFKTEVTQMKLITLDGKELIIPTTADWDTNRDTTKAAWVGHVVTYTPATGADTGKFVVVKAADAAWTAAGLAAEENPITNAITDHTAIAVVNGKATVTLAQASKSDGGSGYTINDDTTAGGTASKTVTANDKTVFVIQVKEDGKPDTYTTYTGINNVPSVGGNSYCVVKETKAGATYAKVVYVADAKTTGASTANVSFLAVDMNSKDTIPNGASSTMVVRNAALITGTEIKQVQVQDAESLKAGMLLKSYTTDANGIITSVTELAAGTTEGDAKAGAGVGVAKVSNSLIKLDTAAAGVGTADHTFTDNCIVWEIDPSKPATSGRFTPKTIAQVATDANDQLVWVEHKDTGKVSALYVIKSEADLFNFSALTEDGGKSYQINKAGDAWSASNPTDITATAPTAKTGTLPTTLTYTWTVKEKEGTKSITIKGADLSDAKVLKLPALADNATLKEMAVKDAVLVVTCTVTGAGFASASQSVEITITQAA